MTEKRTYPLDSETTYVGQVGDKEVKVKSEKGDYNTSSEAEQTLLEVTFGFKPTKESK